MWSGGWGGETTKKSYQKKKNQNKKTLDKCFQEKMEVNLESRSVSINLFSLNSRQVALQ